MGLVVASALRAGDRRRINGIGVGVPRRTRRRSNRRLTVGRRRMSRPGAGIFVTGRRGVVSMVVGLGLVRRRLMSTIVVGSVAGDRRLAVIPVGRAVRRRGPVGAIVARRPFRLAVLGIIVAVVVAVVMITPVPVPFAPRPEKRNDRNEEGAEAVAFVAGVARKIFVFGLAGGIEADFAARHAGRLVDAQFKTAVRGQHGADDLLGLGGVSCQRIAAVDIVLIDQVADDFVAAVAQVLRRQLP